ncbi:hypothetical protein [Paucisalibacillus sp. EB02]|uniref:hypothetical protein n=1 Tax=Paucisalibacillus sp. EB02 TaxID=1347087 RepID=UPI0004AE0C54|nr:hypothetical protein [Paucisalibacillus sp. EB02]
MKTIKNRAIGFLATMLIIVSLWWLISEANEKKAAMNQPEIFIFHDQGELHWFELTIQEENLEGRFHQQMIIDEPGQVPVLEEKIYQLKGEKHNNEYEITVNKGEEITIYNAKLREGDLFVRSQGNSDGIFYKVATKEELQTHINGLKEEFDNIMYYAEHKEYER